MLYNDYNEAKISPFLRRGHKSLASLKQCVAIAFVSTGILVSLWILNREEFGFGYPFLTFKDVFYNFFVLDKLDNLANTTDKERNSCSIKRGDVF